MTARQIFCALFVISTLSITAVEPVYAGIVPKFVKKLNPFKSGNSKIDAKKIKKDRAKEIEKLKKKVGHDPRAMTVMADFYYNGLRMPRDRKKSLELYKKAYAAGDAVAQFRVGEFYSFGEDIDNDGIFEIAVDREKGNRLRKQSIKGVIKLAKKKDGQALLIMGWLHKWGDWGLEKSHKKSRKYFEKSAKRGFARGMYKFGEILLTEGSKKHREACDYFVKSAILGYHRGINAIAYCYEVGRGRAKDREISRKWHDYGVEHYSVDSMIRMGDIYINKSGDDNKEKAAEYYDMAIAEGSAEGYGSYAKAASDNKKAYYYQQALAHDLDNDSYLKEVQERRQKETYIISLAPKTYSRQYLLDLAQKATDGHAGAREIVKDFMLMGFVKSLEPVSLLTLGNGYHDKDKDYGTILFFSPNNKTLTISQKFNTKLGWQTVNSTWEVATGELIRIRPLKAGFSLEAASSDGKKIIMEGHKNNYWESIYAGKEQLTINDSATGEVLFTLFDNLSGLSVYNTKFTGNDKYLNVVYMKFGDENAQLRNKVFSTIAGEELESNLGRQRRKVSANGLYVITDSDPNEGDKYPRKGVSYNRLPSWYSGNIKESLQFYTSIFSANGRYWIMPERIYDLKEDKDLGKHGAAQDTSVSFNLIPNTPLLVRIYRDGISYYLMEGSSIVKVGSSPMDVEWSQFETEHVFSPDFTKVTIMGVREGRANKEVYIQSLKLPTDDEIAKNKKEQEEKNKSNNEMTDVLEMFEIGFDDQAMEQMKAIIAKEPTSINVSYEMMEKRTQISATAVGLVIKTSIEAALAHTDIIKIGVKQKNSEENTAPGTGDVYIEEFILFDSNVRKAGARKGDKIISLDGIAYFKTNTPETKARIKSIMGNQRVTMVVERGGQQIPLTYKTQIVPDGGGRIVAMKQLFWYGLLANAAGHPEIAEMAATRIKTISTERIFILGDSIWGESTRQSIALLKAVALASKGDHKAAYNILFADGSMKDADKWAVKHFNWYPDLFTDLFKEPKKMAYILGKKVEDLPKLGDEKAKKVKEADFWTLDGRLIMVGETSIVKEEEGGFVID